MDGGRRAKNKEEKKKEEAEDVPQPRWVGTEEVKGVASNSVACI